MRVKRECKLRGFPTTPCAPLHHKRKACLLWSVASARSFLILSRFRRKMSSLLFSPKVNVTEKKIAESKKKLFTVKKCRLTEKEHSSVSCKKSLTVNGRVLLVRIVRCMWNYKSIIGKFQCFKHQQKKCFQGFLSSVLQAQQLFTVHKSDLSRVLCDCKLCCTFCLLTNCRCLWYVNGNSTP